MTRPGIEPLSLKQLANTLPVGQWKKFLIIHKTSVFLFSLLSLFFALVSVKKNLFYLIQNVSKENPSGVMANGLDNDIVVSEFELQSRFYIHFQTNTLGKGMNSLILSVSGYIVPLLLLYEDEFSI